MSDLRFVWVDLEMTGLDVDTCAIVEMAASGRGETFGVGIDSNIVTASLKAIISGINRLGLAGRAEQAA